jgi:DNA-binding transcriptional LysR family regulator
MNIHHLELFYYVAKHGGVSAAARRIPYGIQQPAISGQVIQLESTLGTPLFTRRPFQLTKAGEELFRFIEPFFGGLDEVADRLRNGGVPVLRIGALETVQRSYLPDLLNIVRQRVPGLRFTLESARIHEMEERLLRNELDLAIAPLAGQRAEGIRQKEMIRVPLALLLPAKSRLTSAETLWQMDRIDQPLVSGPAEGPVWRKFQEELQKRNVEWFPAIVLTSQDLVARYVAAGFGIGLVLLEIGAPPVPGTKLLPLPGFPEVPYGVLWAGELTPLQKTFCEEAQAFADRLTASAAPIRPRRAKK